MILLIDNYDSFSYKLYNLIETIEPDIQVVRNDELSLEDIHKFTLNHWSEKIIYYIFKLFYFYIYKKEIT